MNKVQSYKARLSARVYAAVSNNHTKVWPIYRGTHKIRYNALQNVTLDIVCDKFWPGAFIK